MMARVAVALFLILFSASAGYIVAVTEWEPRVTACREMLHESQLRARILDSALTLSTQDKFRKNAVLQLAVQREQREERAP